MPAPLPDSDAPPTPHEPRVAVAYGRPMHRDQAGELAKRLGLPLARGFRDPHPLHLMVTGQDAALPRLELRVAEAGHPLAGGHDVAADLASLDITSSAGRRLNTPLLKAVGIKRGKAYRPTVLDATAGLGEDAWLLAAAGCTVTAVERQPIVHALLGNALARARTAAPDVADRLALLPCQDAAAALADSAEGAFDVVLLDPMFPGSRKAMERKAMRVLRMLAGDDEDAQGLWPAAARVARRRVVVKRPRKAPTFGPHPPTVTHQGRGFRFDVYAVAGLNEPPPDATSRTA